MCEAAAAAARAHLRGVMAEGVNDVPLRADWRRRGGLCARHWRDWRSLPTPALSSAILTRDLLGHALAAPPATVRCPACEAGQAAEGHAVAWLRRASPADLAGALEAGRGFVCVRHLATVPAGPKRDALRRRLEALLDDLDTFVRLSDHRHAGEPFGESGDAWLRAIRALGGDV